MLAKNAMAKSVLLFFLFFLSISSFAQKSITGAVLDADSKPLSGVTIKAKGGKEAVTTNDQGKFTISVGADVKELQVSTVGFESQSIAIGSKTDINIIMTKQVSNLNEVVVVGYSSQRKKDITGAVTVVNVGDLKTQPTSDAASQLQGRASGVTIVQSGIPGEGATVRIRGLGSFSNNNPLYVIDGVQTGSMSGLSPNDIESMQVLKDAASASIYGSSASNGVIVVTTKKGRKKGVTVNYDMYYGTQNPGKGLEKLNAQEEAELYFLARRNSNLPTTGSVYGNGTTPVLPDYIYYTGYAGNSGVPIMNGNPAVNPALYELTDSKLGEPGYSPYLIVPASKSGTDWYRELTRNAPIQNHNISMNGSNENSRFLLSLNYFNQEAITKYQFFKRYTARLNSEFNVFKGFRIGENLQVFATEGNTPGAGDVNGNNNEASVISQSFRTMSIVPVYNLGGGFGGNLGGPGSGTWGNSKSPVAAAYRNRNNRDNNLNLFGNVYAEVDFTKHITARTSFGGSINNNTAFRYPFIEYEYTENNGNTTYNEGLRKNYGWIWTNQLTYKNTIGKHSIAVLAGTESQKSGGRQIIGAATGFFNYSNIDFINLGNGTVQNLGGSQVFTPVAKVSYFARADYAFDGKYILSVTSRNDKSSKFVGDNQSGNFSAFSLGWRVSQESFMKDVKWINDLKLRGSWGQMGNDASANSGNGYQSYASVRGSSWYDIFGTQNSPAEGFFLSFGGNPAAKWETGVTSNVGFDATLFGGSTEVVFDWYQKKTEDLLFNPEVQATAGGAASLALRNVGSMKNSGIDLMISNRQALSRDLKLTSTFTFTTYSNEITAIAKGLTFFDFNSGANEANRIGQSATRNIVGNPINTFFGYKVIGLFQSADDVTKSPAQEQAAPGRFKYADINGDNKIDANDRTVIGNPNPKFTYGLNLGLDYKGFDFSAFFYGVAGKDAFNFNKWWMDFTPGDFPGGRSKRALYDSWLPDGSRPNATTPIQDVSSGNGFSTSKTVNSYYVESASYLRLRNLQIGYTLPTAMSSKAKISKLRVYLQAANLFTITKYTGLNPDIVSNDDRAASIDNGNYPVVRQYLVGLNVTF